VLRRHRLGGELKRCREAAGLTQEAVSRQFEWHTAKVTRIETARVAVTPRDVRDLLTLYGVRDDAYRESLIELARKARERTWRSEYSDVTRSKFVGLEAGASAMLCWEPTLIPGLLQTERYMRSLVGAALPAEQPDAVQRRIAMRLIRQHRLTEPSPLLLKAIIDESVLHRAVGDDDTMADQLRHVRDAATVLPNVTVQILPFAAGAHQLLGGPATLLEFGTAADRDVLYLEGFTDNFEHRPAAVTRFRAAFDLLSERALDERTSIDLIDRMIKAEATARPDHQW
jgi:transcriptional regulator with XRE-family HTH domain